MAFSVEYAEKLCILNVEEIWGMDTMINYVMAKMFFGSMSEDQDVAVQQLCISMVRNGAMKASDFAKAIAQNNLSSMFKKYCDTHPNDIYAKNYLKKNIPTIHSDISRVQPGMLSYFMHACLELVAKGQ